PDTHTVGELAIAGQYERGGRVELAVNHIPVTLRRQDAHRDLPGHHVPCLYDVGCAAVIDENGGVRDDVAGDLAGYDVGLRHFAGEQRAVRDRHLDRYQPGGGIECCAAQYHLARDRLDVSETFDADGIACADRRRLGRD